ncbi:hypothetical protein EUZ85_25570 [Hahella sp. KA22]|uniref:hypothetical protein n=1 Tax=Hahella sp. KA22 TaxID=1628392 RepID=UPI000FDE67E2|nr:hypothetical protein [Hahella sp. KA22]AZZ93906.1 hypothetical protein ENC22_22990 [Hahella sp. KA22]QAY57279.1 hypothetical protein EUZ85_25570 [Hahella sp. KA22]
MTLMICSARQLLRALLNYRQGTDIALEQIDPDEGAINNAIATSLKSGHDQRCAYRSTDPTADLMCKRKRRPPRLRLKIRLVRFSLCTGVSRAEQGVNELSRAQNTLSDYLSGL